MITIWIQILYVIIKYLPQKSGLLSRKIPNAVVKRNYFKLQFCFMNFLDAIEFYMIRQTPFGFRVDRVCLTLSTYHYYASTLTSFWVFTLFKNRLIKIWKIFSSEACLISWMWYTIIVFYIIQISQVWTLKLLGHWGWYVCSQSSWCWHQDISFL